MLNVYTLPKLVEPEELLGGTAVVIDVFRSTTAIVHALAAGAREEFPCAEVEDSRKIARQFPAGQVMLGGERSKLAVKGFDLGNLRLDQIRLAVEVEHHGLINGKILRHGTAVAVG
jgi:2-phosphosulfolactate phosphatase